MEIVWSIVLCGWGNSIAAAAAVVTAVWEELDISGVVDTKLV